MSISLSEALLVAVLGVGVVFIVLIILMTSIEITSKLIGSKKKNNKLEAEAEDTAQVPVLTDTAYFDGSMGEVKTFSVPDRTAAMIMAVVADQSGIPLGQLYFKSIKEISE